MVAIGVQANHIGYHLAYLFISLVGLAYELTDITIDIRKWVIQYKKNKVEINQSKVACAEGEDNMSLASVESNDKMLHKILTHQCHHSHKYLTKRKHS